MLFMKDNIPRMFFMKDNIPRMFFFMKDNIPRMFFFFSWAPPQPPREDRDESHAIPRELDTCLCSLSRSLPPEPLRSHFTPSGSGPESCGWG